MDTVTRRNLISTGIIGGVSLPLFAASPTALAQQVTQPRPIKIQVVLFDGFEVTDALAPFDALKISSKLGSLFETTLVTVNGATEVTALDDVRIKPTATFNPNADLLLVPGSGREFWSTGQMPEGLVDILKRWRQTRKTLVTVCTGAVFVARTGLLKGRNVTTHQGAFEAVRQEGANLINARVVDDGDILSSGGVTSGIDLALYLIERYFGAQLAIATETVLEYERRGTVWRA